MESPPKRVTRARAAAKTNDSELKITTAASKAKATRSAPTTKRKARSDDTTEEEHNKAMDEVVEPKKTTRGRPKKNINDPPAESTRSTRAKAAAQSECDMMEELAPKPTRARVKKPAVETQAPEPAKSAKGRAKKVDEHEAIIEEAPKRSTRGRAATVSKATAPKKTVTFEEPDKENVAIAETAKGKGAEKATGMKARPVRKPAITTRATRGKAKTAEEEKVEKPTPLSPKKATQVATAKECQSEDELATTQKTPMKPLMKSPIKPPGSVLGTAKKLDFSTSITAPKAQDLSGSIVASRARRPPQSPFKDAMKDSPKKLQLSESLLRSPMKMPMPTPKSAIIENSFKASLLQSPARRPTSPTKAGDSSPGKDGSTQIPGTPKTSTFKISRFGTPRIITRPGQMAPPSSIKINKDTDSDTMPPPKLTFSGRLSSILPREVDPVMSSAEAVAEDPTEEDPAEEIVVENAPVESMAVEEAETIIVERTTEEDSTTPIASPPRQSTGAPASFAYRERDESPFMDSDSEDELASEEPQYSPTPIRGANLFSPITPFKSIAKTPDTKQSLAEKRSARREKIGFTPLARQLSDWMAASPEKPHDGDSDTNASPEPKVSDQAPSAEPSPVKSTFFEDEMSVRDEIMQPAQEPEPVLFEEDVNFDQDVNFDPVDLDEEDLALAHEAEELSLLEPDQIEAIISADEEDDDTVVVPQATTVDANISTDDKDDNAVVIPQEAGIEAITSTNDVNDAVIMAQETIVEAVPSTDNVEDSTTVMPQESTIEMAPSEASQEYGDENAIPIDPALLAPSVPQASVPAFSTPKRVLTERVYHTVCRVPLKAAAEETPMRASPVKRSSSISKLPVARPTNSLNRSNTVISYSPSKRTSKAQEPVEDVTMQDVATPSKSDALWSTMGTPARTPRRDLNPALLKGAILFVDVHTTEGADASSLFTELLTQMGARCVKSWNWNGNGEDGSKIGITHVVFKDGGVRTIEKARETGGVVSCVGVGWVLDCERENKWLDEAPYSVDTAVVPRGGHRRRKSMEPRALANLNGTLATTPSRTPRSVSTFSKDMLDLPSTAKSTKSRRRESVEWIRSPASSSYESNSNIGGGDKLDDETMLLAPATPAPGTSSRYGEEVFYEAETPGAQTPYFLHKEQLIQKTAPVKNFGGVEGQDKGWPSEKKDKSVMMRLMAARRKSLQWAPKVGSPLARGEF